MEVNTMTDKKETLKPVEAVTEEVITRGREIWLAGLGALAAVEEEGSRFFKHLVERGRSVEDKGKKQLSEVRETLASQKKEVTEKLEEQLERVGVSFGKMEEKVDELVEKALTRLDVPTRSEVRILTRKVETLTKKVDKLAKVMEKNAEANA